MHEPSRIDHNTIPLDPHFLSTTYQVQTRWQVITGAPCSGKTTLIDLLAGQGYQIMPEVGRKYIERQIARGRTLDEIRADAIAFCILIKDLQMQAECELPPEQLIFLDRGFPDSLAFYQKVGLNPNQVLPDCFRYHYASVFLLDRFPTQQDCARVEDDIASELLDNWLELSYRFLGYNVVRVTVLSPEERLQFVLDRIG